MFFYIDEAGNTGNNLFDCAQPRLSYGVLSSLKNPDEICAGIYKKIQYEIGKEQIHANELGVGGLLKIVAYLIEIQKIMRFNFDYYFIVKQDYALVSFFNAVFDSGLNKAVKAHNYWTPLRFLLINDLATLFDDSLLRESWRLCTEKRIERYKKDVVRLLSIIKMRAESSQLDSKSIEIIMDAMNFGIDSPLKLDFGCPDQKIISPNAVGFQFVVSCIARRLREKRFKKASSITIDRQHQFNNAQFETYKNLFMITNGIKKSSQNVRDFYVNQPLFATFDEAEVLHEGLPDQQLTISSSADSIGLQIVDVYLWIANRIISSKSLPDELRYLWSLFDHQISSDNISLQGMMFRFEEFEKMLP